MSLFLTVLDEILALNLPFYCAGAGDIGTLLVILSESLFIYMTDMFCYLAVIKVVRLIVKHSDDPLTRVVSCSVRFYVQACSCVSCM